MVLDTSASGEGEDSSEGAKAARTESPGLNDELKATIQKAYSDWLAARGFRPRRGQREMIAKIARALTADSGRLCIVEAGTGTGKTIAYCLPAIPVAQAAEKQVVIATATVALQEQVAFRDLPELAEETELSFKIALAKGRGRYICLNRLEGLISGKSREPELFDPPSPSALPVYNRLVEQFAGGKWDGDRDSWPDALEMHVWRPVTNDRAGCSAGRCSYYHQCPFFRARQQVSDADVIVANHDLVLADLSLGGGVVLPPPADTIYILDEAHHLPDKTRSHFTVNTRLQAADEWLTQLSKTMEDMSRRFRDPSELRTAQGRLAGESGDIRNQLADMERMLRDLPFSSRADRPETYRFPHGEVPEPLAELAKPLGVAFNGVNSVLDEVRESLQQVLDGDLDWPNRDQAEACLPAISQLNSRAEGAGALFTDFGDASRRSAARWASRVKSGSTVDVELTSAPLRPGDILGEALWESCHGAVATSATLCALGSFDRFRQLAGVAPAAEEVRIPSPFDFANIATFTVPDMKSDPTNAPQHTREIGDLLPELLEQERSALALFTSWRQFNSSVAALPPAVRSRCRLQDTASRQVLLDAHRRAIDDGERSYLFGLASFAEGLDLPGDYCRHVIIAKIPFAVPDNPVDEAMAEWMEDQGRNPFFEIAVPDASLRLIQACGRLIRNETDGGRITLLDNRIFTKGYGYDLLEALPPYRLVG